MNIIGLVLIPIGIGIIFFVPHLFILQIIRNIFYKNKSKNVFLSFFGGILLSLTIVIYAGYQYNKAIVSIKEIKQNDYKSLEKNYMTEKIIGMHFIYHTKIEMIYDGWRPPIHEPLLIIGMWLNNRIDPLKLTLKERLRIYKTLFPKNKFKFNCSCGILYRDWYQKDELWKN